MNCPDLSFVWGRFNADSTILGIYNDRVIKNINFVIGPSENVWSDLGS
jgi:hypothetical protein